MSQFAEGVGILAETWVPIFIGITIFSVYVTWKAMTTDKGGEATVKKKAKSKRGKKR